MKRILTAGLLTLLTIISTQCRKSDSTYTGSGGGTTVVNKAPITATLQGNITDENGQPTSGVIITVGDKTATTDNNGYFRITAAALDKQASFVLAQKSGYFNAYRSFCATSGTNQIAIQLIKRTLAGTVSATSGGAITLSNGAKVVLPANGVVNASSNAAYSGTINVYAVYIDPSDNSIAKTIPGSFMANDKNNNRVSLASFGMLAVELQSSDGQKLQIATGNTATLTTPIPASLQAKAPATISMWYMNEQTGLWQEEGSATKNGSNYIGTVKHFSYWNCDYASANSVQFSATFKTADGLPLVNAYVTVSADSTNSGIYGYAHGYTDSLGQVSGLVPANVNLIITIYSSCYIPVYTKNISALSSTSDLGTITVPVTTTNIITIKGKLVTCNNTPVSNGYAIINFQYSSQYVQCNSSGDFITTFVECSNSNTSCQITGYDNSAHQQGNATTVPIATTIINAGNITACGNRTPYYITLKGKLVDCNNMPVSNGTALINYGYIFTVPCDSAGNFSTSLYYYPDSSSNCQVTGINIAAKQQGTAINISLSTLQNDTLADAGNIIACGTALASSSNYIIDGVNYSVLQNINYFTAGTVTGSDSSVNTNDKYTYIQGNLTQSGYYMEFYFRDDLSTTGTFPLTGLYLSQQGSIGLVQPFNITITNFPQNIGDNYEGSFSGQFIDSSDINHTLHTISGSFKQPRTY
jgi:hypothetical protein